MKNDKKGITPIIAVIILLLITLALAASAWVFLFGMGEGLTSKIVGYSFGSENNNKVMILNQGTSNIVESDLLVFVEDQKAAIMNMQPVTIDPEGSGILTFLPPLVGNNIDVNIISSGSTVSYSVDINEVYLDGLLGFWKLDDDISDSSANGNDMEDCNDHCPEYVDGKFGKAGIFDGFVDVISTSDIFDFPNNGDLSYSAWINTNEEQTAKIIGAKDFENNYILLITLNSNRLRFKINNGIEDLTCDTNYDIDYDNGEWHHVAAVRDYGNSVYIYFDGQQVKSCTDNVGGIGTPNVVSIAGPWGCFQGQVDEVMIFDRLLTPDEIQKIYQMGI